MRNIQILIDCSFAKILNKKHQQSPGQLTLAGGAGDIEEPVTAGSFCVVGLQK